MTWLVAGLGNPGPSYARTRHNAGAMAVELLAERAGERFRKARFVPAQVAELRDPDGDERVLLVRSTRFMNESGPSYASVARKAKVAPDRLIARSALAHTSAIAGVKSITRAETDRSRYAALTLSA